MSEKPILLDIHDKIATITLNRPDRKNAINTDMVNGWVEILDECRDSDSISAIILTGSGEAFCAGGDKANLGANNKIDPLETKNHFWDHFQRIAKKTAQIEKPIVAAVNGMATGAGMDMSLHCDIRFASKNAIFRASYAAFGLVPGNGGTYFLPRIVGTSKALELFWSTDVIDAEESEESSGTADEFVYVPDDTTQYYEGDDEDEDAPTALDGGWTIPPHSWFADASDTVDEDAVDEEQADHAAVLRAFSGIACPTRGLGTTAATAAGAAGAGAPDNDAAYS